MAINSMNSVDSFIGRRIRQFRWVHGISQADLARRLSIELGQIVAHESGSLRISAALLFQISEVMNVPVTEFFEGIGVAADPGQTVPRKILSTRESQLLFQFSLMSDQQQEEILNVARTMEQDRSQAGKPLLDRGVFWPDTAREG